MVDLVKGTLSYKDKRESHANKFVQDLHNSKILLVRKDIKAGVDSHVISIATSAKEYNIIFIAYILREVLYVKFKDGHQFNIWMQHLNAARDVDVYIYIYIYIAANRKKDPPTREEERIPR